MDLAPLQEGCCGLRMPQGQRDWQRLRVWRVASYGKPPKLGTWTGRNSAPICRERAHHATVVPSFPACAPRLSVRALPTLTTKSTNHGAKATAPLTRYSAFLAMFCGCIAPSKQAVYRLNSGGFCTPPRNRKHATRGVENERSSNSRPRRRSGSAPTPDRNPLRRDSRES